MILNIQQYSIETGPSAHDICADPNANLNCTLPVHGQSSFILCLHKSLKHHHFYLFLGSVFQESTTLCVK